jgi:hypothetical protein
MTDMERTLAVALRSRAAAVDDALDARRLAEQLARRLDAEDRNRRVRRSVVAVAAALLLVTAGGVAWRVSAQAGHQPAGPSQRTTSPSPDTNPPTGVAPRQRDIPLVQRYHSRAQHYSLSYPAGWSVKPLPQRWHFPHALESSTATADLFATATGRLLGVNSWDGSVVVQSEPIPAGMTSDQWVASVNGVFKGGQCSAARERTFIDGHQAWIQGVADTCGPGDIVAVVTSGHRGYVIAGFPLSTPNREIVETRVIQRIIASMQLTG